MKHHNAPRPWALATLLLAPMVPLVAEEDPALRVRLEEPQAHYKDRFGISYRASFNITAQFKNVGDVAQGPGVGGRRGPGPATGGGVDRFYDDGYNRVDSTGSRNGLTWFWGYKNPEQVVGDTLVMHSTSVAPITSKTIDSDIQHGGELTYNRELGRIEEKGWLWGVEGAFGWTDVDIRDHRPLAGGVRTISDAFNLGGVDPNIPPTSPEFPGHAGNFQGPNALIEDAPTRTVTSSASGSTVYGVREFDGNLWTWRLGPYIDFPLDERWTISLSAGVAVGLLDGEYRFRQNVSTPSRTAFQSGKGDETEILFGGYASMLIHFAIDEHWGAFVGGQYMGLSDYSAKAAGQKIELDLARTAFWTLGLTYSF